MNQEQLKEEFKRYFPHSNKHIGETVMNALADWWLNERQALLMELKAEMEGKKDPTPIANYHYGVNEGIDTCIELINNKLV